MGKVSGLVACSSVLTALVCCVNLGQTAEPAARPAATTRSAGDWLADGKAKYLDGKYAEAIKSLETALASGSQLHEAQKRDAAAYLERAKANHKAEPVTVVARGQSPERYARVPGTTPRPSANPELAKQARKMMLDAQNAVQRGNTQLGRELALRAQQFNVMWGENEVTPEQLLQTISKKPQIARIGSKPDAGEKTFPVNLNAADRQANAKEWLAEARHNFNTGNVDGAEKGLRAVQQLNVKTKWLEDSPEKLSADIAEFKGIQAAWIADSKSPKAIQGRAKYLRRRAAQLMEEGDQQLAAEMNAEADGLTGVGAPKAQQYVRGQVPANNMPAEQKISEEPAAPAVASAPPRRMAGPAGDDTRYRVTSMLRSAHAALDAGDVAKAETLASNAQALASMKHMEFGPDEESPEAFLAQLPAGEAPAEEEVADASRRMPEITPTGSDAEPAEGLEVAENTVPARQMPVEELEESPAEEAAPAAAAGDRAALKAKAKQMVKEARAALAAGQVEEARAIAMEAGKLEVTYDLLEDQPAQVLTAIANGSSGMPNSKQAVAGKSGSTEEEHQVAVELVKQGRQALKAGKLEEARSKAMEAERYDVTYSLLEEDPNHLLMDIERATKVRGKPTVNPANVAAVEAEEMPAEIAAQETAEQPARRLPVLADEPPEKRSVQTASNEAESGNGSSVMPLTSEADESPVELAAEAPIEDENVISPKGESAAQLYRRGLTALKERQRDQAYQLFKAASQSGERLPPQIAADLRQKMAALAPKGGAGVGVGGILRTSNQVADGNLTPEVPAELNAAVEERQVELQKLQADAAAQKFKAVALSGTNPDEALSIIDQTLIQVENSPVDNESKKPILRMLASARSTIAEDAKRTAPLREMKQRNKEVMDGIKNDRLTELRIETELAEMVKRYNELFDQKRFSEAEVLAKKAAAIAPENPVTVTMLIKAKFGKQNFFNEDIKAKKADYFTAALNGVEEAAGSTYTESIVHPDAKTWGDLSKRRGKYGKADQRRKTEGEQKIEKSLDKPVSLHFQSEPFADVVKTLTSLSSVNLHLDIEGMQEEGINTDTLVTIHVDDIKLKSALHLILEPLHMGYTVQNEVLKITSQRRCNGELQTVNYTVADLVVPIPNFTPVGGDGMPFTASNDPRAANLPGLGQANFAPRGMNDFAQFQVPEGPMNGGGRPRAPIAGQRPAAGGSGADFDPLMELIQATIEPESWDEVGGPGSVRPFETTLSLVVRQTQAVHDQIADLLDQLRRLQDLQVTVEVRFVTVSDRFFERIGVDFDFNVQDNAGDPLQPTFGAFLPPFGNGLTQGNSAGTTGTTGGQTGQQGQQGTAGTTGGGSTLNFANGPPRDTINRDNYPKYGTIIGQNTDQSFPASLDIPFRQGSFPLGVPRFGGFQADAGLSVGLAILSDIETFFLINASQGDDRNNLMFAPKITMFNGQQGFVSDTVNRPFVTSLIPTVGFFSVGFQPQITIVADGVQLQVQAVISADRRYVRLTVSPNFRTLTDVQTFSFVGGQGGQQGGVGQQQGNGFGGGQFGGGGQGGGQGVNGGITGQIGQGGQQGQQGQQGQAGASGAAATQITVQQPIVEVITLGTTVSVPDGGTVLLGGIKRLREGRTMFGVPILNKIPYVSRLFKNTGVGRETESLMMMVTPRIIIQEEEEDLLGIPQ